MPRVFFPLCLLIASAVCLGVVSTSTSAAPPRPLGSDLIQGGTLSADQERRVDEWVQYYAKQLTTADPAGGDRAIASVEEAREKLRDPLTGVFSPSESFRLRYSNTALPVLGGALQSPSVHTAVNALLVISDLQSTKALDLAMDHVNIQNERRMQIRVRAAKAVRSILLSGAVPEVRLETVARRLRRAAEDEVSPHALLSQLQAIAAAASVPMGDGVGRDVRSIWTDALRQTIEAIGKQAEPTEMLNAVRSSLPELRLVYLELSASERRAIGERLGPALGEVMSLPLKHDTSGPNMRRLARSYKDTVQISQEFLKLIDRDVRPSASLPQSDLSEIMKSGWSPATREQFETELSKFRAVLSRPPYKG